MTIFDSSASKQQLLIFFRKEYQNAGIDPADIQTGAVIVTGESSRKQNTRQIAEALSNDAGKFVAATVMEHLGLTYNVGDSISKNDIVTIAAKFADILFEAITDPANSALARRLMLTADLDFPGRIDEYAFSGGVAELMYGGLNNFSEIGHILADKINLLGP